MNSNLIQTLASSSSSFAEPIAVVIAEHCTFDLMVSFATTALVKLIAPW